MSLTHGFQLLDKFIFRPLAVRSLRSVTDYLPSVLSDVQIVNEHDVRVLEKPVAATVKGRQNGRVHVAAVDTLDATHLEFHVVFADGFAIASLLPAVAIFAVAHLPPTVEKHRAARRAAPDNTFHRIVEALIVDIYAKLRTNTRNLFSTLTTW